MDEEQKREFGCVMIMVVVLAIAAAVAIGFMAIAYFMDKGEYDPNNNTEGQDVYEEAKLVEPAHEWHSTAAFDSATLKTSISRQLPFRT